MAVVTLNNAVDSYTDTAQPTKNYSAVDTLWLVTGSRNLRSFIYFGIPSGMFGGTVLSAKLRFYNKLAISGTRTLRLHRLTSKFAVGTVTNNTQPTATEAGYADVVKNGFAAGELLEFDITYMLQQVANGAPWYGVRLTTDSTALMAVWSANAATSLRPQLVIEWSDAPHQPEVLVPDNGEVVSIDKPVLNWDFTDLNGDQEMQAFQLKLFSSSTNAAVAPSGTSPVLDTGVVYSDTPELDLSTTAYAGLNPGTTLWWRVAVQDGAGLWSKWSDPAYFVRQNKGTLTLNNPAASPNDFVTEPTPPIDWTFTGGTQRSYQIIVTTPETPAVYLWNSGIVTSTNTFATIPAGVIKENGKTYTLIVRVYDPLNRRSTPGDPNYVQVARTFTFNQSATVSPVTDFTGTPHAIKPQIALAWSRATAPDQFLVYRDGVVVATLNAPDVFVSGTSYAWNDNGGTPRKNTTWSVAAVVNGVVSSGNPSVVRQVKPVTTTLSFPDSSNTVFFFNPDVSAEQKEASDIHYIVGPSAPVLITQALRGYEGTINGVLVNDVVPGETADTQLAKLLLMKRMPGATMRLVWVNKVMNVVIRNVTHYPIARANGKVEYYASFEFFQVNF